MAEFSFQGLRFDERVDYRRREDHERLAEQGAAPKADIGRTAVCD